MAESVTKARPAPNRSRPPRDGGRGPAPHSARALLWALPPVALLALFFLYPLALVVQQSFQPDGGGTSLQPYTDVFASAAFRHALWTTVWIALASTAGCLVLGFLLALVIAFVPFPGVKAVARFVDVYLSFPSFLITLALLFIYGTTGITGSFQFLTTPWGVLLAEVTYFTPFVMRPCSPRSRSSTPRNWRRRVPSGPARRGSCGR